MVSRHRHGESRPLIDDVDGRDDDGDAASPTTSGPWRSRPAGAELDDGPVIMGNPTADADTDHPDAPIEPAVTIRSGSSATSNANVGHGNGANRTSSPLEVHDPATGNGSGASTPRFIQDERAWKHWKWVPYSARRVFKAVAKWSHGPPNPQPYRITPFFPMVQEYPLFLLERFIPKRRHRAWLLFFYFSIWLITFVLVKREGTVATEIAGWGQPQSIGCGTRFWASASACGLDGNDCRPFNNSGFPFRCQGSCESFHVLNPYAVGDRELIYQPVVIGGPSIDQKPDEATYRGDSFICGAAIHAGVISNANGGCGVVELVGQQADFNGTQRNGITSVGFNSYFPLSLRFIPGVECEARDMRWSLLAVSSVFTGILSLFTSSAALFFFPNFVAIFWTVGMALDPPTHSTVPYLFSNVLGKFLPAMFCAWVMYDRMGVRRTLNELTAQIEKTILWLGPCWVGAMDNYTLSFIPIQRLNAHDLNQQPGAKAALAIIIIVLTVIIASQVWFFRQEGRFRKYIKLYGLFVAAIIIALVLPRLELRLHHYILALLLLPGTSLQTRPSLIYQGLLIGLFINGIARWGFDPVLQTPGELQGDAQLGSTLPTIRTPQIDLANSTNGVSNMSNITFTWERPTERNWDGISVLVNDVERFRTYFEDTVGQEEDKFVWGRESGLDMPEYFRFALMDGSHSGDYTKAGIWTAEGEWVEMAPGPSRVKSRRGVDTNERTKVRR